MKCDMTALILAKKNGLDGELIVSVKVQNFLFDRITPRYQINGERALVIV